MTSYSLQPFVSNENKLKEIKQRKDISFITFTNYGYIHYTKNLIVSLEKSNFPLSLKVYCIDQKSFDELKQFNQNILLEMLNDETNTNENIVGWREEGWNTMVFSKLKCIHKELLINEYVFFTDSDIVFETDCLQYLIDNLKDYDMLIQQNFEKKYPLNTGFMFMKSNKNTKDLFDWTKIDLETFETSDSYIYENKDKFNYYCLNKDLFPVEIYYKENININININPYIIHFNKHRSYKKIKYFKKSGKWYL